MSEQELQPWSNEMASLLESERHPPTASAASTAARARIFAHVEGILGPALDTAVRAPHASSASAAAKAGTAGAKASVVHGAAGKMIAVAFATGAIAGAGGYATALRLFSKPAAVVATQASVAPAPIAPALAAPAPDSTSPAQTAPGDTPPVRSNEHVAKPAPHPSLPAAHTPHGDAEARALVETARTALQRGDAAGALATLDRLGREHAQSAFDEEAQALRVMSLGTLGRAEEARREAAAFHRRHPESLLGQAVDASIAALPAE